MTINTPLTNTIFPIRPIETACGFTSGFAFKSKDFDTNGYPVIKIKNIQSGRVTTEGSQFIPEQLINSNLSRFILNNKDVLIAMTGQGSVGRVGQLKAKHGESPVLNQRVGRFDPDEEKLNRDYLYYVISTKIYEEYFFATGSGSGQPNLSPDTILSIGIPFPSYENQLEIAKKLCVLDDKIELNRQINKTLEQIAQAIFKSWFVDFEPVKAKIEAKQNGQDPERTAMRAISGKTDDELDQLPPDQLQQLTATAALFPDELVDSEQGLIPKGWKAGKIGDVATAKGGYAYKSKVFTEIGHPVVKIKNIVGDGAVDLSGCQCIDDKQAQATGRFKLLNGDLLMAMTGATVGKIGLVVLSGRMAYLNQRVAKFESSEFGSGISWFLFCAFQKKAIFEQLVGTAQGSAQPNISSKGIESTLLVVPKANCLCDYIDKVEPLFSKWMSNQNEIKSLGAIRDTLLPKLLSGELDLSGNAPSE